VLLEGIIKFGASKLFENLGMDEHFLFMVSNTKPLGHFLQKAFRTLKYNG
jgi:hypothetical protein